MYTEHEQELFINGVIEAPTMYEDIYDDSQLVGYWEQYHQGLELIEKEREAVNADNRF